ncbi:DUF6639 family protein [Geomonas anaerohicana]|uniref:Lysine-specific metallo-endopeptidase domain-containing protein n=1 Tax=Geomonas anaerohicana TaxID=2798583 RepID=A0ABS0YGJ0_9BACT|nr:DUF6639 family protein [Geomonas anaerohicana]MBJ6751386.1 hypothetical protein [Geomonas anaerohicana]
MKTSLLLVALVLYGTPLFAEPSRILCQHSTITVLAETKAMSDVVCEAVQVGGTFLRSLDLNLPDNLTIRLSRKLPKNGQHGSLGYYNATHNEIRLLDYEAACDADKTTPLFGIPMTLAMWRSVVIHEITHAAAQNEFTTGVPTWAASEYIASVVQFSTLPEAEQDKIKANYPGISGFASSAEISLIYYMLDPAKFILNSYLHFCRQGNGSGFIRELLLKGLPDD